MRWGPGGSSSCCWVAAAAGSREQPPMAQRVTAFSNSSPWKELRRAGRRCWRQAAACEVQLACASSLSNQLMPVGRPAPPRLAPARHPRRAGLVPLPPYCRVRAGAAHAGQRPPGSALHGRREAALPHPRQDAQEGAQRARCARRHRNATRRGCASPMIEPPGPRLLAAQRCEPTRGAAYGGGNGDAGGTLAGPRLQRMSMPLCRPFAGVGEHWRHCAGGPA